MMGAHSLAAQAGFEMLNQPHIQRPSTLIPTSDNTRAYRDALGCFGTGVTIVTTATEQGPVGMTVNSFASVSLTPALMLWSLAKSSGRFPPFDQQDHYAIHILSSQQEELALKFARDGDSFDLCEWQSNEHGVPLISNTLVCFECSKQSVHDAGDHVIIVGQVDRFQEESGQPLIFANGKFGSFVQDV